MDVATSAGIVSFAASHFEEWSTTELPRIATSADERLAVQNKSRSRLLEIGKRKTVAATRTVRHVKRRWCMRDAGVAFSGGVDVPNGRCLGSRIARQACWDGCVPVRRERGPGSRQ